jgi:nitroreductase
MALKNRVSVTGLVLPIPSEEQLRDVFSCAARAADHGKLKPWRFLVIAGERLAHLSDIYVDALAQTGVESAALIAKAKNMPFRAPMIIVAIAKIDSSSKVPKPEQIIACGAATQNILNSLFILGFGAIWRTGDFAYDRFVAEKLGLSATEEIIGFVYVGTPEQGFHKPSEPDLAALYTWW